MVKMLRSMTGFSKGELEHSDGRFSGEVRSLNNRYLEINVKMPKMDYYYEQRLRELAKRHVKRGKIDITIKWDRLDAPGVIPRINESVLSQYIDLVRILNGSFGVKGQLTVESVLGMRDIIAYEENNKVSEEALMSFCGDMLKRLDDEKAREGELILNDLTRRLDETLGSLREIEVRWPAAIKDHEERLRARLFEAVKAVPVDNLRILQELALYMERIDITEEIVRLRGHIDNFRETLDSAESVGRKLDFIIQEMVRETNTIGSKSNDLFINERVIRMKVEIEKMREQVQNVE